jgi:hypothetical protein
MTYVESKRMQLQTNCTHIHTRFRSYCGNVNRQKQAEEACNTYMPHASKSLDFPILICLVFRS